MQGAKFDEKCLPNHLKKGSSELLPINFRIATFWFIYEESFQFFRSLLGESRKISGIFQLLCRSLDLDR